MNRKNTLEHRPDLQVGRLFRKGRVQIDSGEATIVGHHVRTIRLVWCSIGNINKLVGVVIHCYVHVAGLELRGNVLNCVLRSDVAIVLLQQFCHARVSRRLDVLIHPNQSRHYGVVRIGWKVQIVKDSDVVVRVLEQTELVLMSIAYSQPDAAGTSCIHHPARSTSNINIKLQNVSKHEVPRIAASVLSSVVGDVNFLAYSKWAAREAGNGANKAHPADSCKVEGVRV